MDSKHILDFYKLPEFQKLMRVVSRRDILNA